MNQGIDEIHKLLDFEELSAQCNNVITSSSSSSGVYVPTISSGGSSPFIVPSSGTTISYPQPAVSTGTSFIPTGTIMEYKDEYEKKHSLIEKLKLQKKNLEEGLEGIRKSLESLENFKLNKGDAAYHRDHGKVIIRGFTQGFGFPDQQKVQAHIAGDFEGVKQVDLNELLPLNETTELLYKNK